MTRKSAIKWHKNLVGDGYFRLASSLLSACRGGSLVIRDGDDEAYESGLADYLLEEGKYINRKRGFCVDIGKPTKYERKPITRSNHEVFSRSLLAAFSTTTEQS